MCKSSWVHEAPSFPGGLNGAVVPKEFTSTSLEVLSYFVEGDVDGERRGVVVRSERPLSVRAVFHNKVQQSIALGIVASKDF